MTDTEIDDGHGYVSAIRVALRWSRKWGAVIIVAGVVALVAGLVLRYDPALSAAIALVGIGAGLPATVSAAKAYQSKHEGGQ